MPSSLDHCLRWGVLAAVCVSVTASAQFLDLDPVPEDPPLHESTLLEQHATRLRTEIDTLRMYESADDVITSISGALHTYRRIAFELLVQARVHPDAHHCALVGLLLAEETGEIDRTLVLLGEEAPRTASGQELDLTEVARLLALLDRFSAQAPNLIDSIDVTNTAELDAALLLALNPLLEVLATLESVALADPWIATEVDAEPPLVQLHMTLDQIEDPAIRTRTMEVIEQIDPLLRFVDLRLQAEIDGTRIVNALRLEAALKEARWLSEQRRATVLARLERTLDEWKTPSSRDHARAGLEHLAVIAELVEATNRLDAVDPSGRAMRRSIDEVVIDDVEADRSARLLARARRLLRARDAVEEAITVREIERVPPGPHLRAARRALDTQYKRAEREVFNRLPELVGTTDALIDPDLAGLVARQHELAEDLKLLRESLIWSDLTRKLKPNTSSRFNTVVQKLAQQLAQTTKRPEASRTFDTLATHFRGATHQPFLDRLRQTDQEAIRMVGGRDRELLVVFDESCAELIADWSDGNPDGEGVLRFELLLRLLAQLEMLSELIEAGGSDHLSRWGGWLLHPTTGQIDPMLIASRLKIAIESLLRDDIQELANQLDQISTTAPLALLAVRMGSELGPGLRELPESTGARIARVARTPGSEDALVAYRDDLLKLARFTWELNEARKDGRHEDEQAIREYCAALAAQLVSDLEKP